MREAVCTQQLLSSALLLSFSLPLPLPSGFRIGTTTRDHPGTEEEFARIDNELVSQGK